MKRSLALVSIAVTVTAGAATVMWSRRAAPTIRCALCGTDTRQWTTVLWQNEHTTRSRSTKVTHSRAIVDFCSVCAGAAAEDVYTAVLLAAREVDPHRLPWGINRAAEDVS